MTKITKYYENITINGSLTIKNGTQSNGFVLISDSGGTGTWTSQSSLSGSSSGSTGITIYNTVFVSKNGNNATGLVQRLDKPFLTIAAARIATNTAYPLSARTGTTRYLIKVASGNYTEQIILDNYTDYDLTDSVIDLQSGANYTIDDNNVACNSIIYGNSTINRSTAGTLGVLRIQNTNTNLVINCNLMTTDRGNTINVTLGSLIFNGNIFNTGTGNGVDVSGGNVIINGDLSHTHGSGGNYGVSITGGISYIKGNLIVTSGALGQQATLFVSAGSIEVLGNLNSTSGAGGETVRVLGGIAKITGNILRSAGGAEVVLMGGGSLIHTGDMISTTNGTVIDVTAPSTIIQNKGTISGTGSGANNAIFIDLASNGTYIFNNSRILVTGTNTDLIDINSTGLIFNNCTLIATGTGKSITTDGGVVNVKVYGKNQTNKALSVNINQQVNTITVDTNVI